tara:strand:- start:215 stop:898 length:684 start_codon:yes stop_codon:yes gene_type:complete
MKKKLFKNLIVNKPWGYEYLIYNNKKLAITLLNINYMQKTSLHCHSKKKTGFILLSGTTEINLGFYNRESFSAPSKTMIRPGLFHSTRALSQNGAQILELETPIDKDDLIRFEDKYGRLKENYQGKSKIEKINDSHVIFKEPKINQPNTYDFNGVEVKLEKFKDFKQLNKKSYDTIIAVLDGGIRCKKTKKMVLTPGEVIKTGTVQKLSEVFEIKNSITTLSVKRIN